MNEEIYFENGGNFTDDAFISASSSANELLDELKKGGETETQRIAESFAQKLLENYREDFFEERMLRDYAEKILDEAAERADEYDFSAYLKRAVFRHYYSGKEFSGKKFEDIDDEVFVSFIKGKVNEYYKKYTLAKGDGDKTYAVSVKPQYVSNWIVKKVVPARNTVMQLCLILGLSPEETEELLKKGLSDYGFNYKSAGDVTYAYCLRHNKSYIDYVDLMKVISEYAKDNFGSIINNIESDVCTYDLAVETSGFTDDNDFLNYIENNMKEYPYTIWEVVKKEAAPIFKEFPKSISKNAAKEEKKTAFNEYIQKVENSVITEILRCAEEKGKTDYVIDRLFANINNSNNIPLYDTVSGLYEGFKLGRFSAYGEFAELYDGIKEDCRVEFLTQGGSVIGNYILNGVEKKIGKVNKKTFENYESFKGTKLKKIFTKMLDGNTVKNILERREPALREHLLIMLMFDMSFKQTERDDQIKIENIICIKDKNVLAGKLLKRGYEFMEEASYILSVTDMEGFNLAKPVDYMLYSCFMYPSPYEVYWEVIRLAFEKKDK